ncbi:MAG: DUF5050 domain-containing protein [Chloroflexi bacterium]|nr:DUF5050 domain-containing protein [Chloroflexota bacterium]
MRNAIMAADRRARCGAVLLGLALLLATTVFPGAAPAVAQDATGEICVSAFEDRNGDGSPQESEPPLAGVAVTLAVGEVRVAQLTTGTEAEYCFQSLLPQSYTLTFTAPPGFAPTTTSTVTFALASGERNVIAPFGAAQPTPPQVVFSSFRNNNTDLYLINLDGSGTQRLTTNTAEEYAAVWSPDGQFLAYQTDEFAGWEIMLMDVGSGDVTRLTDNPAADLFPDWSPDGAQIAFSSDRDADFDVYVMNADGSGVRNLSQTFSNEAMPSWSPDGARLVFVSLRDGNYNIYTMNADGTDQRRLTDDPGDDFAPAWSPDGSQIAFHSDRDGNYNIYVMNADGSDQRRLTDHPADDFVPAWSPDGTQIVFHTNRGTTSDIYAMDTAGGNVTQITPSGFDDAYGAWRPGTTLSSALPQVAITAPMDGATFLPGQQISLQVQTNAPDGITRVALLANGELVYESVPEGTPETFAPLLPFRPAETGTYRLEVIAYSATAASNPASITVTFGEPEDAPPPAAGGPQITILQPEADGAEYVLGQQVTVGVRAQGSVFVRVTRVELFANGVLVTEQRPDTPVATFDTILYYSAEQEGSITLQTIAYTTDNQGNDIPGAPAERIITVVGPAS